MEDNACVQHFAKLNFDENSKLKPNQLQILNVTRQGGKKVVPNLHEKAKSIQHGE